MRARADYLDVISGLLIIHMIVGHILQFSGLHGTGIFYDHVSRVLFFFMPWFYFKAGLFVSRKGDMRTWVEKDVRRLIVPFVIFSILGMILYVPFEFLETDRVWWKILVSPVVSVLKVGSMGGNLALWFLLNLFLVRLLYKILPERFQLVTIVIAILIGFTLCHFKIVLPITLSTMFPGIVFLLFGCYSKPYVMGDKGNVLNYWWQIAMIIAFVLSIIFLNPRCNMRLNDAHSNYFVWIFCSWLGCLSLIIIFKKLPKIRPLAYIGRHSMTYYVIHWLPLYFSSHIVRYFYPDIDQFALTAILITFVFLTLALFTWKDKWIPAWWVGEKKHIK